MRARIVKAWDTLRGSYWFLPALMALGSILLSFVLTTLDARVGAAWLERVDWLHANQPDGARALLSTIAGSMITVAGVTFSITIAAVAFASSQFGPRILTNFMEDRGNQLTLGTFIATFLYCLLVLRTVRSMGEPPAAELTAGGFVPHLAILCGVLLTLTSVGVLIYFIHHVPESIHVSNVIARIGHEVREQIDEMFPEEIGEGAPSRSEGRSELPERFFSDAVPIPSPRDGYLHNFDSKGLFEVAQKHDLTVQVVSRPGRFVSGGQTVLLVAPAARVGEEVSRDLAGTFIQGDRRTSVQDLMFLVDELVEIAARALSPGINDPFTATSCMDWLSAGLLHLTRRQPVESCRYDADGNLRVVASPLTVGELAAAIFDQLTPYVSADRNAALHLMKILGSLVVSIEATAHRELLLERAEALDAACRQRLPLSASRDTLEEAYRAVVRLAQPNPVPSALIADQAALQAQV